MPWVLDASVALTWCFDDEQTPRTELLADRLRTSPALVPGIWRLEVANVLLAATRHGRLSAAKRTHVLAMLARLPVRVDAETSAHAFGKTISLADAHQLTIYDAAYLELAVRQAIPLATNDRALSRAASAAGVTLL